MKDFPKPTCEAMTVPKLNARGEGPAEKERKRPTFWSREVALQTSGATFGRGRPLHLPVVGLVKQRSQRFGKTKLEKKEKAAIT